MATPTSAIPSSNTNGTAGLGATANHEDIPVISPAERASLPEGTNVIERPAEKVPFKDQVIGVAQKARGTVTANHELKDHGNAILEGNAPPTKPQ